MLSAALYARVQLFLYDFAHETAGAARIRHSLLPPCWGGNDRQTSGYQCREIADVYLVAEIWIRERSRWSHIDGDDSHVEWFKGDGQGW